MLRTVGGPFSLVSISRMPALYLILQLSMPSQTEAPTAFLFFKFVLSLL